MVLDADLLTKLMIATFGFLNPGADDEWGAIATGAVQGMKLGTVQIITSGTSGSPGPGTGIGAIQGGAIAMVPLVAVNTISALPPPGGAITPLQPLWHLAVSQIATHALTSLQVDIPATDSVAVGVGNVLPGGFQIQGSVIEGLILAEYLKRGLLITPMKTQLAKGIGAAVQQHMSLATMIIPILGGSPSAPPTPTAGTRIGTIS